MNLVVAVVVVRLAFERRKVDPAAGDHLVHVVDQGPERRHRRSPPRTFSVSCRPSLVARFIASAATSWL
jgi:hypothetical protein